MNQLMNEEAMDYLFLKMSAHFSPFLPKEKKMLDFMQNEYFRELHDKEQKLIFENLKKHINNSKYPPSVADLVRVEKKETEGNPYIPNLQETKAMMALDYTPEPASKEFVEQKKKEIERILEEGRKKHEQRVAAVFEQQRI